MKRGLKPKRWSFMKSFTNARWAHRYSRWTHFKGPKFKQTNKALGWHKFWAHYHPNLLMLMVCFLSSINLTAWLLDEEANLISCEDSGKALIVHNTRSDQRRYKNRNFTCNCCHKKEHFARDCRSLNKKQTQSEVNFKLFKEINGPFIKLGDDKRI